MGKGFSIKFRPPKRVFVKVLVTQKGFQSKLGHSNAILAKFRFLERDFTQIWSLKRDFNRVSVTQKGFQSNFGQSRGILIKFWSLKRDFNQILVTQKRF